MTASDRSNYANQLFSNLDDDKDGRLEYDEVLKLFKNDKLTQSDQNKIIQLFDANGDHYIDLHEFKQIFNKLQCESTADLVQKSYLYIIYTQMDTSKDNTINAKELKQLFESSNIILSEKEISHLMHSIDSNKDGQIDFNEFQHAFSKITSIEDLIQKSRLYVIFNSIDADKGGHLDFDEVKTLFMNEQVNINDETLKRMISSIDQNNDQKIDFAEFEAAFYSVQSIEELIKQWASLSGVDVGTDLSFSAGLSSNNDSGNDNFPFLSFVAGGTAGICSRTATAPLERVKILAQLGGSRISILATLRSIIQNEGFFQGLWRGNMFNVMRVFPFGGIVCFTYGRLMQEVNKMELEIDDKMWTAVRFGAGCGAGAIATTLTYPMDLIRTQITGSIGNDCSKMDYKQSFKSLNEIKGLFVGLWPTLFAMSLFVGMQQSSYDYMRMYAMDRLNMNPSVNLFVGCSVGAAILSQTVVYPLDVIRRRMQFKDESVMKIPTLKQGIVANRTWFALRNVVQLHGFQTLFSGIIPTYAKVIPSVAISITVRDIMLGRLQQK